MSQYSWNPVFNIVMRIKRDYIDKYGLDTYKFEDWLIKLNMKEYNDIFESLQVNQSNNILLIRYGLQEMQAGMWEDQNSIYRECRSIVIDLENEAIILCPFRKFFNLNEVEENSYDNVLKEIQNAKSIEISNKLDGSMQSARYYNGQIFLSGSMAIDINNSWRLEDGYNKLTNNHKTMIINNPEYTFIFEYISMKDAHVVLYKPEQEGMYLIGMRNVYDGKQLSYNEIKKYSEKYNVPMTEIEDETFEQIIKDSKQYKSYEKEGWVLNIDGHMIKLKCDDYVQLHRMLDKISSINLIIKHIADGTYDDLISKVPENYRGRVNSIARLIFNYVNEINQKIDECYNKSPKDDRKEFMIWVNQCPKDIQGYLRQKYLGQEYHPIKSSSGKNIKYKKLKEMNIAENYSALFADLEESL